MCDVAVFTFSVSLYRCVPTFELYFDSFLCGFVLPIGFWFAWFFDRSLAFAFWLIFIFLDFFSIFCYCFCRLAAGLFPHIDWDLGQGDSKQWGRPVYIKTRKTYTWVHNLNLIFDLFLRGIKIKIIKFWLVWVIQSFLEFSLGAYEKDCVIQI